MKKIINFLKLLRPQHYIKNLLIFFPIFFSQEIFTHKMFQTLLGFVSFCFMASFVYIINDIKDVEKDRLHPVKCRRPIAAGTVSLICAKIIGCLCLVFSFLIQISFSSDYKTYVLLIGYLAINLSYSLGLKNQPIWDIALLALGFLIRIMYGGVVSGVEVSAWLYLTVIAFALYMGLGKRRNELRKVVSSETRKVMEYYSDDFLDRNMYMCLAIGLVFYSLWAIDRASGIFWTIPVVLIICMKYNLILETSTDGDPVPTLLASKGLQALLLIYMIMIFWGIYINA